MIAVCTVIVSTVSMRTRCFFLSHSSETKALACHIVVSLNADVQDNQSFSYHILLQCCVEEECFSDTVLVYNIRTQIRSLFHIGCIVKAKLMTPIECDMHLLSFE